MTDQLTELEALLAKATGLPRAILLLEGVQDKAHAAALTGKPIEYPESLTINVWATEAKYLVQQLKDALPGLIKELREARASEDRLGALLEHHTGYDANCKCSICAALEAWKARKE